MERDINMNEVSDGRRYTSNDLVKADCGGCKGCSACCRGMGESIILDPMDIYRLCQGLGMTFEGLLGAGYIELNIVDHLILPNLKMGDGPCPFLNEEGRCRIHPHRPGICRLFPLGRIYEDGSFRYFLQVHECPKNKTKVRVKKWIDTPELPKYEQYICDWHYYLKDMQSVILKDPDRIKSLSMEILQKYYLTPYTDDRDFYEQFYERFQTR